MRDLIRDTLLIERERHRERKRREKEAQHLAGFKPLTCWSWLVCFTILLQPLPKFFSLFLPLKKLLTEETFHQNFFHCLSDKIFETFDKLGNFLMQWVRKTFYILSIFVKFKDVGAAIVAQRWSKCLSIKSSLVRIPLYAEPFKSFSVFLLVHR